MLSLGAPDEYEEKGYDKQDYIICFLCKNGLSNAMLADLSERLMKYCIKLQLSDEDSIKLNETSIHYYKLASGKRPNPFSLAISGEWVEVSFRFSSEISNLIKSMGKCHYAWNFDPELKKWYVHGSLIEAFLEKVKSYTDVDVENSFDYLKKSNYRSSSIKPIEKKYEIKEVVKESLKIFKIALDSKILLSFDFNVELVSVLRSLDDKKYDPQTKQWILPKTSYLLFLSILSDKNIQTEIVESNESDNEFDYPIEDSCSEVIYSEIEKESIPEVHIFAKESEDNRITLSFDYNQNILNAVKSLPFRRYDNKTKKWFINKADIKKLEEELKKISDVQILHNFSELDRNDTDSEFDDSLEIEYKPAEIEYGHLERQPFKHQLEAADFLLKGKNRWLCDEQGSGKTFSSILSAYSLPSPRIVICPASLKLNWEREIRNVDKLGSIQILKNKPLDPNNDWFIINYDVLDRYMDELQQIMFNCMILDEAHYIKSVTTTGLPGTGRAENAIKLAANIENKFVLTGTPMTSRPKDIYNLLRVVDHPLGARNKFLYFAQRYCNYKRFGSNVNMDGASNTEELHNQISSYMLRRLKKDMLDLPEKVRTFNLVEVPLKDYENLFSQYKQQKNQYKKTMDHLVLLGRMKHLIADKKANITIEMIDDYLNNNEPIVVFTNYTSVVDKILAKFGTRAVKLTGESTQKQRQDAVDRFQNGEVDVFVGNVIAAGVGITLTRASNIIINDFDWVPANLLQAEDRIHRLGQINRCTVIYQVAKGAVADEKLAALILKKLQNINNVIDGSKGEDGSDFGVAVELIREIEKDYRLC